MSAGAAVTEADMELLRAVAADEVTWRSDLGGRISYRRWSSETEYVTVTPRAKRLRDRKLIDLWHNPSNFGRGGVELTVQGKKVASGEGRTTPSSPAFPAEPGPSVPATSGTVPSERVGPGSS